MCRNIIYFFLFVSFLSCKDHSKALEDSNKKIIELSTKLMQSEVKLKNVRAARGELSHDVFLNVKEGIDQKKLLQEIAALKKIKYIKEFRMGRYKELSDPRALKQFEIKLQMTFANRQDYESYQNDSIHLDVKEKLKEYLERPPASYDFIIE